MSELEHTTEAQTSSNFMQTIINIASFKINLLEKFLAPAVDFLIRLKMASIIWAAGTLKLPDGFLGIGRGSDWDTTLSLFEDEHPVPYLPTEFAAYSATFFELLCPVLLVLGLGARPAAFILLTITAVIEFTYRSYPEHQFWGLLLALILVRGAGTFSADFWIRRKFIGDRL